MNDDNKLRIRPPALPEEIKDWQRHLKTDRTLNDMIEEFHRTLVDDDQYRAYLEAVWDEDAVEGSCSIDNAKAAEMIRNKAKSSGSEVAGKKLATIVKSLGVVLRRYHKSRKERRNMVAGEIVPNDNSE